MAELSQASYKESPFETDQYDLVGESELSEEFYPLEVEVVSVGPELKTDQMFQDFGGHSVKAPKRWHLPEHMAQAAAERRQKEQQPQEATVAFSQAELDKLKSEVGRLTEERVRQEMLREHEGRTAQSEGRIMAVMQDLAKQVGEHLSRIEKQSVDLALMISKKVIDQAVEINPEYIVQTVRQALSLAGGATIKKVRVSPQDMEFIEVVGIVRALKEYDGSWKFEADTSVREGCIVETSAGEIDYQLDVAWERIKDNVVKVLR